MDEDEWKFWLVSKICNVDEARTKRSGRWNDESELRLSTYLACDLRKNAQVGVHREMLRLSRGPEPIMN